jgi:hypothetical protein
MQRSAEIAHGLAYEFIELGFVDRHVMSFVSAWKSAILPSRARERQPHDDAGARATTS